MAKIQANCTVDPETYRRLQVIAEVEGDSIAEVVSRCIHCALPTLELELQKPKLTPEMMAQLRAGKSVAEVLAARFAPYCSAPQEAATLNETPFQPTQPAPAATPPPPARPTSTRKTRAKRGTDGGRLEFEP